ncbi:MAG: CdaR family protein [Spirochaeta sp.]|nr:CdaR family protein [Spirochaeta sp.]
MQIRNAFSRIVRNWPAKILSLAAAILLLVYHDISRLEERFVTVPLQLELNEELVPASSYPRQVRLQIRGESEQVFRIVAEDLRAYLNLRRFSEEGEFTAPVQIERRGAAAGTGTLEVTAEPDAVVIRLEERLLKSLEVVPATSGFPPSGYELIQLIMTPSSVEVEGPRSVLEEVNQVTTEDVDLSNRREDFTERIRLVPPDPLVLFPGGDIVEIRGLIDEAVVLQTFEPVELIVTGLPADLAVEQDIPTGLIRVQARQVELEEVTAGDLQLTVDASQIEEPGTVRLPVRPVVPSGFVVLRYEPTSVQLRVGAGE